jgi:hypothetical protein
MAKTVIRLPSYTRRVPLAKGFGYFWELPPWARPTKDPKTGKMIPAVRHGQPCPVASSPLGTNHDQAVEKAEALNEALKEWRLGAERRTLKPGSIAWLFLWYRGQERFTKNRPKTQRDYKRLMDMLCVYPTKAGLLGNRLASAMDGESADALYAKLRTEKGEREASYAMQVCRLVWRWAVRHKRTTGVKDNPFAGMGIKSTAAGENRPTTRAEYDLYRATARALGYQNMAAAAAICFEGCQRVSQVFGFWAEDNEKGVGLEWSIWKPGIAIALIQRKTGNPVWLELSIDVNGEAVSLYPDLEEELRDLAERAARDEFGRPTGAIILDERNGEPFTQRWMSTLHRRICDEAKLPKEMTFTGFRHGGITEIGDAGEEDVRPISGHKTLAQTRTYNKATAEKGRRIALARREHIEQLGAREPGKPDHLSE